MVINLASAGDETTTAQLQIATAVSVKRHQRHPLPPQKPGTTPLRYGTQSPEHAWTLPV